jgi:AraC family ethanolamine operon transcriptional activator
VSGPSQSQSITRPPARIDLVKEVQQWMNDHPTQPITLTDLCRHAHASRRTLIQGFQDHLGMGPMAYLKLFRLHGIRRRLLQAHPGGIQIGVLADEWGFYNAGHFAADYRRLFGERPKDTLRRAS